jgi:hypothetical protein
MTTPLRSVLSLWRNMNWRSSQLNDNHLPDRADRLQRLPKVRWHISHKSETSIVVSRLFVLANPEQTGCMGIYTACCSHLDIARRSLISQHSSSKRQKAQDPAALVLAGEHGLDSGANRLLRSLRTARLGSKEWRNPCINGWMDQQRRV